MVYLTTDKMKLVWKDGTTDVVPVDQETGEAFYKNPNRFFGKTLDYYQHGIIVKRRLVWSDKKNGRDVYLRPGDSLTLEGCDCHIEGKG